MIIAKASELKEGAQKTFEYRGKPAILFRYKGELRCYVNVCTHAGGPTDLAGDELVCEWHGSHFNPLTGEVTRPPAPTGSSLTAIRVRLEGENIVIAEDEHHESV